MNQVLRAPEAPTLTPLGREPQNKSFILSSR